MLTGAAQTTAPVDELTVRRINVVEADAKSIEAAVASRAKG